jgi:RNA polymerase sigma-70 factor (ECF subfamily)
MPLPDDRRSEAASPDEDMANRESADWLIRLLDELTPNQREVIRLKFQNDLSYKEIADVTGLSSTNVGFLLHVGLKKLRDLLRDAPRDSIPFQFRAAL